MRAYTTILVLNAMAASVFVFLDVHFVLSAETTRSFVLMLLFGITYLATVLLVQEALDSGPMKRALRALGDDRFVPIFGSAIIAWVPAFVTWAVLVSLTFSPTSATWARYGMHSLFIGGLAGASTWSIYVLSRAIHQSTRNPRFDTVFLEIWKIVMWGVVFVAGGTAYAQIIGGRIVSAEEALVVGYALLYTVFFFFFPLTYIVLQSGPGRRAQ